MGKVLYWILVTVSFFIYHGVHASDDINMREVRELAKSPVEVILTSSYIESVEIKNYWEKVHGRNKPLVVFFYSNVDGASQRLATQYFPINK